MTVPNQQPTLALYLSCGNRDTEEWDALATLPLKLSAPYPEGLAYPVMELKDERVPLPNGESLHFSVAVMEFNRSVSIHVGGETPEGKSTLLFIGGFKSSLSNFDPTAHFLTPGGMHVQIMVGPVLPAT